MWELIERKGLSPDSEPLCQVMLRVTDLDASVRYYTEVLGMRLLRKRVNEEHGYTLAFVGYEDEDKVRKAAPSLDVFYPSRMERERAKKRGGKSACARAHSWLRGSAFARPPPFFSKQLNPPKPNTEPQPQNTKTPGHRHRAHVQPRPRTGEPLQARRRVRPGRHQHGRRLQVGRGHPRGGRKSDARAGPCPRHRHQDPRDGRPGRVQVRAGGRQGLFGGAQVRVALFVL